MNHAAHRIAVSAIAAALASMSAGTTAAEVDGPKVEWKFSTWGNPRAFSVGIEKLAEIVKDKTGGNFTIRVAYGEALSKSRENLDAIKINAIDGAHFCGFYHPAKTPAFLVFAQPFLPLADWQKSINAREAAFKHPALVADMDRWNAIAYASTLLPVYEMIGKGEPPRALEDWKGKRVRAGGGLGEAMAALGAIKTTTTAAEMYNSMQRGTVDATALPFYAQVSYKMHEVSDWMTTNMQPGTNECPVALNKTSFEKLPPQYQKLVMDAKDELYKAQVAAYVEEEKKSLAILKAKLKVVTYTDDEIKRFQQVAGTPVWDSWVAANKDKFDAQGLLDLIIKTASQ